MKNLGGFGVPLGPPYLPKAQVCARTLFRDHLPIPWGLKIQKNIPLKWIETQNKSIFVEKMVFFRLFM